MSLSDEWTEWHLTPLGWVRGSNRTDGIGVAAKPEPPDRVLTYRWCEEQSSSYSRANREREKVWESTDKVPVPKLLGQFGAAPSDCRLSSPPSFDWCPLRSKFDRAEYVFVWCRGRLARIANGDAHMQRTS